MSCVAVIVVSYNTRDLLAACLRSVLAARAEVDDLSVWVVDNASADGSAALVEQEFPQVNLLAATCNLGFTGGNNAALAELGFAVAARQPGWRHAAAPRSSRPDYVLLLNPDAELKPGALAALAGFLDKKHKAGVCGPQLEYGDGSFQHGAFMFPTLAQVALDFFPLTGVPGAHRLHESRLNGRYPRALWARSKPFKVDFVLGAALCVRAEAIDTAGGLDDGYFMYCEEMDFCLRLDYYGYGIYAVPAAHVVHHAGQSSRQVRWAAFERLWRSRFRFYARHPGYYGPLRLLAERALVRAGVRKMRRDVQRQFAAGQIDGVEVGVALAALKAVGRL